MKKRTLAAALLPLALLFLLLLEGCDPEARLRAQQERYRDSLAQLRDPQYTAKVYYRDYFFNPYYYWLETRWAYAKSVQPTAYSDIYAYFDDLLWEKDRWSWMCDGASFASSESGILRGSYGVSLGQPMEYYGDYSIRVAYVYPGSPFAREGVTRGWALTHIAGQPVMDLLRTKEFDAAYNKSPQTFTLEDLAGNSHTFTTSLEELSVSPVMKTAVFTAADFPGLSEPVGYFNYLSFKANFLTDIDNAMATLKAANVRYLILDLRYNGGGDSRASQRLVDWIAPASAVGEVYVRRAHNKRLSRYDVDNKVEGNPNALNLKRLYVITGEGTASASEMITNGLRPLMDVKMVGDTTYGKPNGMYVLLYPDTKEDQARYDKGDYSKLEWVFLPIAFYNKNRDGESIPDDGFVPDNYRPDDYFHDFTPEEDNIRACLTHIATGAFPALPTVEEPLRSTSHSGVRFLSAPERDPHYGLDLIRTLPGESR